MFKGIKNGAGMIDASIKAFNKHPDLIIPLLFCWAMYTPIVVYLKFFFPWDDYSTGSQLLVVFLAIFIFSFILSVSSFILLELIRQIETGKSIELFSATFLAIPKIVKSLPVTVIWALLWFLITVIEMLLRRRSDEDNEDMEFNAENVAKAVAGFEDLSLSAAFFDALKKGVRMVVFLIYPSISWEKNGFSKSVKRGLAIVKAHKTEFVTGFVLTDLAAAIVFLPPAILFFLSGKLHIEFPDWVWFITLAYCGFAWSFSILLEQMFAAELYLWHMLWERNCSIARINGDELPEFEHVKRPSILDSDADLSLVYEKDKKIRSTRHYRR